MAFAPIQGAGALRDPNDVATLAIQRRLDADAERGEACMISSWVAFWDSSHSIYVNARHKAAYYRLIGPQIAALFALPCSSRARLRRGGGSRRPDLVASAAGELLLCEAAPRVRANLTARFLRVMPKSVRSRLRR